MAYAKEKWFSLMRNEVEEKQMVYGDNKRFNPLRDDCLEDEPIFISIKRFQLVLSILQVMTGQFPFFLFRLSIE